MQRKLRFFMTATLALTLHFALFKLRYGWYTTEQTSSFLSIGYATCALSILLLWAFYPSRVLVAIAAIFALVFPFIFLPETFAQPNLGFAAFATIPVALLIFATHLRKYSNEGTSIDKN